MQKNQDQRNQGQKNLVQRDQKQNKEPRHWQYLDARHERMGMNSIQILTMVMAIIVPVGSVVQNKRNP